MADCAVLILAGGTGARMGNEIPKQYLKLCGKPVLRHTVEAFLGHPALGSVRVVIGGHHRRMYDAATTGLSLPPPVTGGTSRQQSARAGLEAASADAPAWILIHDAARPFVDSVIINRVLAGLRSCPAVLPALPVTDTLKRASIDPVRVTGTVDRSGLWRSQTPQGFHFDRILKAHRQAEDLDLTDDAAVAEHAGLEISLVPGSEDNFKISTPGDFGRAERYMGSAGGEYRVGSGFDVHAFGGGQNVTLCGVVIPHERGLSGHSDADVALHAITDALLGAISGGDIGEHFPPSDSRWRGAASRIFAAHAAQLIADAGGVVIHVDVTIMCTRPRIGPHRQAMRDRVAEILAIDAARISVKATTTEGLGFIGRNEGIAAQASATIRLPSE